MSAPVRLLTPVPAPPVRRTAKPHERVVAAVAAEYGVDPSEVLGRSRVKSLATARNVAMFLTRECFDHFSYPEIGRQFDRDHTTVMSGCRRVALRLKTDPRLAARVARLRQEILTQ